MDKRNWVIANIPVRKGLEERYGAHVNVATVGGLADDERKLPQTAECGRLLTDSSQVGLFDFASK